MKLLFLTVLHYLGQSTLGLGLILFSSLVLAQSSKGTLVGNVTDPSGAGLSGAAVRVTNTKTNVLRETITAETGNFRLDAVDPGIYTIEVTVAGFKSGRADAVLISAGQTTSLPMRLEIGEQTDFVQVGSDTLVILQTQDGARTSTIDFRQMTELPISNLDPTSLISTLPGALEPSLLAAGKIQGTEVSVNGLRPRANSFLLDGTDNNENATRGQNILNTVRDAYQEVTVLGGNYSAEYGSGGGTVVNVVTRSGTNAFHGSVYNVISTSALSSLTSGEKTTLGLKSVPVSILNQPGASLGGPILKNRLFFFITGQSARFRSTTQSDLAIVPTAAGAAQLRTLFPQGQSTNLDYFFQSIGNLRGVTGVRPVTLGGNRPAIDFGAAARSIHVRQNTDQVIGRIDWAATSLDSVAYRFIVDNQEFPGSNFSPLVNFDTDDMVNNQNHFLTHTHTFSPTFTNEFRLGYTRANLKFFQPETPSPQQLPALVFNGARVTSIGFGVPPFNEVYNNYQYQDTVTYSIGTHTFRAGVDIFHQISRAFVNNNNANGTLIFSAGGGFPSFGNFVDMFSGTQGFAGSRNFDGGATNPNEFRQVYFVNDSWRVTPNLTFNLGLRYENFGAPFNILQFPAFPGLFEPFDKRVRQNRDNNNFAPRFSFAYTPQVAPRLFGDGKTVVRGGYGISYDVIPLEILTLNGGLSPNVSAVTLFGSSVGGRGFSNFGLNSLPTSGTRNPLATSATIDPNIVNPLTHTWNAGVQRELFGGVIVDVAYVGTRGTRLLYNEEANFGINGRRVNPARGPILIRANGADSIYHALQTRVEQGFRNGLFFRFAYTYSKAIDNNSEIQITTGGSPRVSNFNKRDDDRGVSAFDAPHRAVWSFVWDIPGPKTGILGQVAGGWTVSGIYRVQSGAVESPFIGGFDINRDLNPLNDRPAISNSAAPANSVAILASVFGVPGGGYVDANGDPLDPGQARYIVDPRIRAGIAGRNTLRSPRTAFGDLSATKAINLKILGESHKLEFRFELFNVFNTANYTWDFFRSDGDVFNPDFNNVLVNAGNRRTARFQLRYVF